ncbi:protein of unknown function [Rhodococcoides kyotonense]|uniref:Uncharacterized protein n=2 Tax=Rhodococcoides kyotonense TaxID=398843 RepID=A0A239NFF8_9NOCA|nr:protein of unknown function [Rhodococcus kyotonensis]
MSSIWPPRVWPRLAYRTAPLRVLIAAVVAGVVAACLLGRTGIGFPLTAAAVLAVAAVAAVRRPTLWGYAGATAVFALATVPAFRAAEWLTSLSIWCAIVVAGAVACRGRTWTGLALGAVVPVLLPARVCRWASRGARDMRTGGVRSGRVAAVVGATGVLVVVFGALFAAADPVFAGVVDVVTPEWDPDAVVGRAFLFVVVGGGALGAAYVVSTPPRFDMLARASRSRFRLWEWTIPLSALVVVFGVFVTVQATTLFGGQQHVLVTDGLTNAEYARQGFWQLLAVTGLTLAVLAVIVRKAARETTADSVVLRVLLGALCALSLVVVASALHRMSLYEKQYGYTTLRLFVTAVELLLGVVFVLVMIAGITMSGSWLPRAVGVSAVAAVLGLAVLNPDAYIARHNVERFEQTGRIDVAYLRSLSADAARELDGLPEPYRHCALGGSSTEWSWYEWNLGNATKERVLAQSPVGACGQMPTGLR